MKISRTVKVTNDLGLHIRPAAVIVKLLQNCQSSVFFTHKKETINARSIMSILTLIAKNKSQITITVNGKDANKTMKMLQKAFRDKFGE